MTFGSGCDGLARRSGHGTEPHRHDRRQGGKLDVKARRELHDLAVGAREALRPLQRRAKVLFSAEAMRHEIGGVPGPQRRARAV